MKHLIGSIWVVKIHQNDELMDECTYEFFKSDVLINNKYSVNYKINKSSNSADQIIILHPNNITEYLKIENNLINGVARSKTGIEWNSIGFLKPNLIEELSEINKINYHIESVHSTIADYRSGENNIEFRMSKTRIEQWLNQFDLGCRLSIISELDNVLKRRYCSRNQLKVLLAEFVIDLSLQFHFSDPNEFLRNAQFIHIQEQGKSQTFMLEILNEVLIEKFGFELNTCGSISKKYSIYLDDVLCTGQTLYKDLSAWSCLNHTELKSNLAAVIDGDTVLILYYIFLHNKNFDKKLKQFSSRISVEFARRITVYYHTRVENDIAVNEAKLDFIFPTEFNQPASVNQYKETIIKNADNHNNANYTNYLAPEEFYRPMELPVFETFFTNTESRKIMEDQFLLKGLEIVNNGPIHMNRNLRALGYSIPSTKNFGFGALCFTWRNVPNNTPLVFWYSMSNFLPLFRVYKINEAEFH